MRNANKSKIPYGLPVSFLLHVKYTLLYRIVFHNGEKTEK